MTIRGRFVLAAAVLALLLPAQAASKHALAVAVEGTPLIAPDRYVLMVGQGSVTAMPDTAIVSGGVVTKARTAGDALHDNNEAMAKVVAALKALGITDKQIATSRIQFQPVYPPYDPKTGQSTKVIGYQVSNSVRVTLSELSRAGDVLDALIENGANESATIDFEIKDRAALEEKARTEASKDALRRALAYANQVGAELGPVRSIREGYHSDSGADSETVTVTAYRASLASPPPPPPPPPPGTIVQAGEETISATVTVVWALK
ncbi:MAG: SIMPL domain-containing protein [Rhizomicrobium sp.]